MPPSHCWLSSTRWSYLQGPVALFVPLTTEAEFTHLSLADRDTQQPVAAVIIGDLGEAWVFTILNQAFRLLMRQPYATGSLTSDVTVRRIFVGE
jgi:hypothetical protein